MSVDEVNLFRNDSYDTDSNGARPLGAKLFGWSRWYFYCHNFGVFVRTGKCARRGGLDAVRQTAFSNENFRLVEHCGCRIHLRGLDHLRSLSGRSVVLMGNHMSLLETAVLHAIVRPHLDFTFVIKKSLFDVPYFGDIMRSLGAIGVGRENPREDLKTVLNEGKKVLEAGRSIILFPQSTRSSVFDPESFNSIGVKLAQKAGVPVMPMALKTDFLGNGRWLRDLGPVRPERDVCFSFGRPLEIAEHGKDALHAVTKFIASQLEEWEKTYGNGSGK